MLFRSQQYQTAGVITKNAGWTQLKYEFKPANAQGFTNSSNMIFLGVQDNCAGQVWIDDMTLTKKGDPIPNYLNMLKETTQTQAPQTTTIKTTATTASSTVADVSGTTTNVNGTTDSNTSSSPVFIIIIALVVIIGGCIAAYFFVFKKKI